MQGATEKTKNAKLRVDADTLDRIRSAMTDPACALDRDEAIEVSTTFDDGYRMLVRCFGAPGYDEVRETSLAEAILFDEHGCEVDFVPAGETFLGEWEVLDPSTNTLYTVHVTE